MKYGILNNDLYKCKTLPKGATEITKEEYETQLAYIKENATHIVDDDVEILEEATEADYQNALAEMGVKLNG